MNRTKFMLAATSAGLIAASATAAVNTETDYDRQDNSTRGQPWERAVSDSDNNPRLPNSLYGNQAPPVEVDGAAFISGTGDGSPVNVEDMIANSSTIAGIEGDIASNTTRIDDNAVLINENRVLSEAEMQALQDRINDLENGSAGGGTPSVPSVFVTEPLGSYGTGYPAIGGSFTFEYRYLDGNTDESEFFNYDQYASLCDIFAIYEVQQTNAGELNMETAIYKDVFIIDRLLIPARQRFSLTEFMYLPGSGTAIDQTFSPQQRRIIEQHSSDFGTAPGFFQPMITNTFGGKDDVPATQCPDQQI